MTIGLMAAALILLLGLPFVHDLDLLARGSNILYSRIYPILVDSQVGRSIVNRLPSVEEMAALIAAGNETTSTTELALSIVQGAMDTLSQILLAVVLSIYLAADGLRFERLWLSLLPPEYRIRARHIWRQVELNVGAYIRSKLFQSLLIALALLPIFRWLDLRYFVIWTVMVAFAWLIPVFGGPIATIGVGLSTWFNHGGWTAGAAVLATALVLIVIEYIMDRRLLVHRYDARLMTVLVMIALVDEYGLLGLLFAPPIAIVIQVCLDEFFESRAPASQRTPLPGDTVTDPASASADGALPPMALDELEAELARVRALLEQMESPTPRMQSMVERLTNLIDKIKCEVGEPHAPASQPSLPGMV
jgi:predicted PurR-regulated permease PerM